MHALPSMERSVSRFYGVFHLTGERTLYARCETVTRLFATCWSEDLTGA
jgi:hypothetical protein